MTDHPTGRDLAEKGIRESHDHAEAVRGAWTDRAVKKVDEYAKLTFEFMAEDVRDWAYASGLEEPPAEGAWGTVMRWAAAQGIIHRVGTRPAKSPGQHGKLMTVWQRGPESIHERRTVRSKDAHEMADSLKRFSEQMRKEGRTIFAERLLEAERMLRDLAA